MTVHFGDGTSQTSAGLAGTGKIIQVVTGTKSDVYTSNENSFTDVTGMNASITPTSSSNKVLVCYSINWSGTGGGHYRHRMLRGSTVVNMGDADGSCERVLGGGYMANGYLIHCSAGSFLDSPSTTSSTTYKIQHARHSGGSWTLNRNGQYSGGAAYILRGPTSHITLMEVTA